MYQLRHPLPLALAWTAVLGLPTLDGAEGTRLIGTGPVQVGTAGAGVASPQNSSWLSLNPAGLVDVSNRVDGSLDIINGRVEVTPEGAFGNTADGTLDDSVIVLAPALTWVKSWDGQAVGFGFYTLSGLAMDLPGGRSAIGDAGGYDNHAEVRTMATSLAYARKVTAGLSVALAANLIYSDIQSNSLTVDLQETAGNDETDRAIGGGFSLSLYQRWEQVSLGANYISRQWMQSWDKYDDLYAGPPDQPPVLQVGIAWRPLPWFEPMLDYRWIDWDSVAVYGNDIPDKGLGWRDQHIIKLACSAAVRDDLVLRAGVSYGRSPIDESVAFANALSVLTTEWHATLGVGWQFNKEWDLQFAYLHGFKKEVTDNGGDAGGFAEGTTIGLEVDSVILGVGWKY
jgi:long-chain fatty acid transport protein